MAAAPWDIGTGASAYEKGLPGLPGKSLGVGLKMVSDSKPVGEK